MKHTTGALSPQALLIVGGSLLAVGLIVMLTTQSFAVGGAFIGVGVVALMRRVVSARKFKR